MKGKYEIQTDPVDPRMTLKSWTQTSKGMESRTTKFGETSKDFLASKFPRTKSHAQIMRTSMKTFLTDLNIPFPPPKNQNEEENEEYEKKRRRSYAKVTPEFNSIMNRVDKTVDKLHRLNEKFQKSLLLSNPHSSHMQARRSQVNIFSPTSVPIGNSNSRPSTKSKNKINFPDYCDKDFEDPDGNESLIEAIRLIDGNKKSEAVADAMWVDLGEGYKMYDHLVHERKKKEKEMRDLQEYLKSLSLFNNNQDLHDKVAQLNNEIEIAKQQVEQDEMHYEILESMLKERKAHADLMKQRFNKKYENLPKIELGLQITVNEIKKDTAQIENTMINVGTMYGNLRSLQKLSKVRENDLLRQIKENNDAENNIVIEQHFKDQREEYIKQKKKEEEKELNKQENELVERLTQEIIDTKKQIEEMKERVSFIMQRTKQSNNKEDILRQWHELLEKNENLKFKIEEAEAERDTMEKQLNDEMQELQQIQMNYVTKGEVNDIPELSRRENEVEKAHRELEKEQEIYYQNQRLIAGYLAGFSKTLEDIHRKKVELGVDDMEIIPCTEENFEKVLGYVSYLVERIFKAEGSIGQSQQLIKNQTPDSTA